MNISKIFWFRLKDNIGPIIFLSILQILITIELPGYSFLGVSMNSIIKPIFGIVGMIGLIWLFTASDKIEDWFIFNYAPELDEPVRTYIKILTAVVSSLTFIAIISYFSPKVFFNYSKSYYIILWLDMFFLYYFLYWAIQKRKTE